MLQLYGGLDRVARMVVSVVFPMEVRVFVRGRVGARDSVDFGEGGVGWFGVLGIRVAHGCV